jgi:hypothetical protein
MLYLRAPSYLFHETLDPATQHRPPLFAMLLTGDGGVSSSFCTGWDLENLYRNQLEPSVTKDIFENDDNLKSILHNAHNRGRREEVKQWVAMQRISLQHPMGVPRIDIKGRAAEIIHALLAALKLKDQVESEKVALTQEHDIAELRLRLRAAHEKNWKRFSQSIQARSRLVADRGEIVSNAMSRILLSEDSPSTPALMSPVTPLLGETPSSRNRQRVPYRTDLSSDIGDVYDLPQVIHTQGYVINSATQFEGSFCGPCSLCGGTETLLMLLFKKPPQDLHTPGFPGPGSRAKLTFPLAMGCFPEIDVISTYLCCDPCSSHLARLGTSPLGDEIIGSYPLLRRGRDENQSTWIEALDEAFQKRFDRLDIELVFLAVLHNTREYCLSQSEHDLTLLIRALQWTFNMTLCETA